MRVSARTLDGAAEAHLAVVACSDLTAGRERWTLRLLADEADELVRLEVVETVAYETRKHMLAETREALPVTPDDPARHDPEYAQWGGERLPSR